MKIYIDERERELYTYLQQKNTNNIVIVKEVLSLGDVILKTDDDNQIIIIERKTIQDLLSSIKDGRYREQSHRLIHSSEILPHRIIYLIEGMFQNHSLQEKQMVYSSMVSLNQIKGFSVMRTLSIEDTGQVLLNMTDKLQRELEKGNFSIQLKQDDTTIPYCSVVKKVKKENITPENMGEIILCQIPGISSINAVAIMKSGGFSSISKLIDKLREDPKYLETIYVENNGKKRKLSKTIIENIHKYLLQ